MLKRTITGIGILLCILAMLYFSYLPVVMMIVCLVMAELSSQEILCAAGYRDHVWLRIASAFLTAFTFLLPFPHYNLMLWILLPFTMIGFGFLMVNKSRVSLHSGWKAISLSLIVTLLFRAWPQLRLMKNGLHYLSAAILVCVVTDVFAYLVGRAFGKHKLIPTVSPNKTVEGAVGGLIFAVVLFVLVGVWVPMSIHYSQMIIYCILASVVGQFGDLCMSCVKRICGVKDFGKIFPGHGGILDRFDSQLLVIPFTVLYLYVTDGFIL